MSMHTVVRREGHVAISPASGATSTFVRGGRNKMFRGWGGGYRGASPPGEKFSKKKSVFRI